jgi:hypothetical protein
MSPSGTTRKSRDVRFSAAIRGIAYSSLPFLTDGLAGDSASNVIVDSIANSSMFGIARSLHVRRKSSAIRPVGGGVAEESK